MGRLKQHCVIPLRLNFTWTTWTTWTNAAKSSAFTVQVKGESLDHLDQSCIPHFGTRAWLKLLAPATTAAVRHSIYCFVSILAHKLVTGCTPLCPRRNGVDDQGGRVKMVSFCERVEQLKSEAAERDADPLLRLVERAVAGFDAISTHSICDLVNMRPSSGNARRIARCMRALGYVPLKSRKLEPGGWRCTVGRGWARPVRIQSPRSGTKPASANATSQMTGDPK